jgi:hypothetical protein
MEKLIKVFNDIMGLSAVGVVVYEGITKALINGIAVTAYSPKPNDGDCFTLFIGEHGDSMEVYASCVVYSSPGDEEAKLVQFLEDKGVIGPKLTGIQYALAEFCNTSEWVKTTDYYESKNFIKKRIGELDLDEGVGIWLGNGNLDAMRVKIKWINGKISVTGSSVNDIIISSDNAFLLRKVAICRGGTYHLVL